MEKTLFQIRFDGPPSQESGRFIETEDGDGHGIGLGTWEAQKDGTWLLKYCESDLRTLLGEEQP